MIDWEEGDGEEEWIAEAEWGGQGEEEAGPEEDAGAEELHWGGGYWERTLHGEYEFIVFTLGLRIHV